MPTNLTICPFCNKAALEWRDEKEDAIVCPGCGAVLLEVVEVGATDRQPGTPSEQ